MSNPVIVFEDEYLLVISKPSGWIVNEASTTGDTPVIQTWISENFDFDIAKSYEYRSGIVHRLDKETSGVLIIAKTKEAFRDIQSQFKSREVSKTYIALLHGKLAPEEGNVKAPVGRLPWNRERFGVLPGGRKSKTDYKVKEYYKKGKEFLTLAEFKPITGRTHQIRIHAKYLHHPIVADPFYAGRKTSRRDRKWCPRLFLHAYSIKFTHPIKDSTVSFNADLSQDLQHCLDRLDLIEDNSEHV